MCTVVDASNFLELFDCAESLDTREDLGYAPPEEEEEGDSWAAAILGGGEPVEQAYGPVSQVPGGAV
eukprot:6494297-Prymnesium_polylepis.1